MLQRATDLSSHCKQLDDSEWSCVTGGPVTVAAMLGKMEEPSPVKVVQVKLSR
jgi:hypothetical protein